MRQLSGQEIATISSGFGHVVGTLFGTGPDGQPLLFSWVPDGSELHRWDIRTGELVWCYDKGMSGCNDAVFVRLPDGNASLAVATEDGIEWWDALTGRCRSELSWEGWTIWALSVGLLPGGRPVLLGAGHDGGVYRWDAVSGEPMGAPLRGHGTTVMAVGFVPLPDGTGVIVSGDEAGRIRRWDAASGDPIGESIVGHASKVCIIEALPAAGAPLFASSDQEGVLRRWDAVTGAPVGTPIETGTDVYALAKASVGGTGLLLAAGADDNLRAWEADSGEPIDLSIRSVVVSALTQPDGMALLATSTARGDIVVHRCSFRAE